MIVATKVSKLQVKIFHNLWIQTEEAAYHVKDNFLTSQILLRLPFPGNPHVDSLARQYFPISSRNRRSTHASGLKVAVHTFQVGTAQLAVEAGADRLVHVPELTF
jgi:hypothetical protein